MKKKNNEKLHRHFMAMWVKYYPHIYPSIDGSETEATKVFDNLHLLTSKLANTFGVDWVITTDWPKFLALVDSAYEEAVKSSQEPVHKEFIEKAMNYFLTGDFEEMTDLDFIFDESNFEDEYFGPMSAGYYGIEISEEQAAHLIGLISEGR